MSVVAEYPRLAAYFPRLSPLARQPSTSRRLSSSVFRRAMACKVNHAPASAQMGATQRLVVIGGIVTSTLLTLLILPALYALFAPKPQTR
ncbi:MAG: hypothetical protein U0271_39250 [Polyangiaceae bacterium]